MHPFHRTELLVGRDGWRRLQRARVMVVGVGGVGGYAAEALGRAGVGDLTLVDFDDVCITNLNRQIHATRRTVGAAKAAIMADRLRTINPKATVRVEPVFFAADNAESLLRPAWAADLPADAPAFDYVIDAIDNVTAKICLLEQCVRRGIPVLASMGAGGRMDPTRIRVTDISRTAKDPFAKVVRKELRARGIERGVECVWTDEEPNGLDADVQAAFRCICPNDDNDHHTCDDRNVVQGTVPWVPAMFGMMLAGTAVNRMLGRPVLSADRERPEEAGRGERARLPVPEPPRIEAK